MDQPDAKASEASQLRRTLRDVVALSTLPAVWAGYDARGVAESLADVLVNTVSLDLVYIRLTNPVDVEVARGRGRPDLARRAGAIAEALGPLLARDAFDGPATVPDPGGAGLLRVVRLALGPAEANGFLIVGSRESGFPTESDQVLLSIGANQAATVIQRKCAEAAVRDSERHLRDLIDALPAAVYTTDAEGHLTHFNSACVELSGRVPQLGTDTWCVTWKLFHPDGTPMPHDQCPMAITLKEGRPVRDAEAIAERPNGERIWFAPYPTPLRAADGRIVGGVNMLVDITSRKRAEAALRRSEQTLADFFDNASIGLHWVGPDGTILRANRAELDLVGYAPDEYIGHNIAEFHADQPVIEDILRRLRAGQELRDYRARMRCKDGSIKNVLISSNVLWINGKFVHTRCFTRDITEQTRAEAGLRKQTDALQLLWESAAVLLTADDPDAMLHSLFARVGPHLGVDAYFNFMVTDHGDALQLASCEGIPEETARAISRLEFGQAICGTAAPRREPIVATCIQTSDEPMTQLVKSFGIRTYACNPLMAGDTLLGTLSFASRTKDRFEPEELAFLQTISQYVTVAYERLRLLNELTEADQRKNEFLATLAHELRNPLAPVRNAVQLLRLKGPDQPELTWSRDVIERQVDHLTRLIDDLIDISRISRNRLELRTRRVELSEIITGAVEASRSAIEQGGHSLTVSLPPHRIYLEADLIRLTQVFLNLLNNAAKYTERGGRIDLVAEHDAGDLLIRVKDSGVGIAPEALPRLFEMFFQANGSLERSQSGLGVGLSLVRRLVEMHGGQVEARSEGAGMGSEFIVRLPVLVGESLAPEPQPPAHNGHEPPAPRRILIVDDNEDSADSLAMLLQLSGNEVRAAYDGLAGLEVARTFRPGVVLLDIGMPKLNGLDACRRIRQEAWGKDIVLIALTGWGQDEDRRRTVEAGFDSHLVKPVDFPALAALLASLPANQSQLTGP